MPLPTNVTSAYLIDLTNPINRVNFQYMPPSFTESKTAEYAQVNILGRSEPVMGYYHSGPRLFNFVLTFVAVGQKAGVSVSETIMNEVIIPVRMLRSWVYPDYSLQQPSIPHPLLLVMGTWLTQRVIMLNYNVTYSAPWQLFPSSSVQFDTQSSAQTSKDYMKPYKAEVALVLQEVTENTDTTPWDTNQVRDGVDADPSRFGGSNSGGTLV